jgi:hypothetical protein
LVRISTPVGLIQVMGPSGCPRPGVPEGRPLTQRPGPPSDKSRTALRASALGEGVEQQPCQERIPVLSAVALQRMSPLQVVLAPVAKLAPGLPRGGSGLPSRPGKACERLPWYLS